MPFSARAVRSSKSSSMRSFMEQSPANIGWSDFVKCPESEHRIGRADRHG